MELSNGNNHNNINIINNIKYNGEKRDINTFRKKYKKRYKNNKK